MWGQLAILACSSGLAWAIKLQQWHVMAHCCVLQARAAVNALQLMLCKGVRRSSKAAAVLKVVSCMHDCAVVAVQVHRRASVLHALWALALSCSFPASDMCVFLAGAVPHGSTWSCTMFQTLTCQCLPGAAASFPPAAWLKALPVEVAMPGLVSCCCSCRVTCGLFRRSRCIHQTWLQDDTHLKQTAVHSNRPNHSQRQGIE